MSLREKSDAFHQHLDMCQQCRENPFKLCDIGHRLLVACGEDIKNMPTRLQYLEGAEAPASQNADPDRQVMDQRGMDQRIGRTYQEIEDARKDLSEAPESKPRHYSELRAANLFMGAWLALNWVLDDDERPLRERLRNAAEGRG